RRGSRDFVARWVGLLRSPLSAAHEASEPSPGASVSERPHGAKRRPRGERSEPNPTASVSERPHGAKRRPRGERSEPNATASVSARPASRYACKHGRYTIGAEQEASCAYASSARF